MAAKETDTQRPNVPLVRIFLSSPGDVAEEREVAREFIKNELAYRSGLRDELALQVIAWDDPAARIPMLATETPQDSVNAARPRPADCDIVIVILWSRMGTPLPDTTLKPNGARYLSGTEWEYEDAVNSPRKPPPQVLLFRRTEKPRVELDDPDFDEKRAQFRAVNDFFARFRNPDGSIKAGVNEYATPAEFKELLRQHLDEILHRLLPPAPRGGGDQPPPADFRKYLQDLWEETALIDIRGLFTGKPEAQRFPIEDLYIELSASGGATAEEPEPKSRPKRGDALLKAALQNQHLVIIGDPGCGKTTFLRWVAHCLAGDRTGRTPGAAGQHLGLDRARLPVLVPIADWLDFIARCKAQNKGPALDHGAEWLLAYLGERATDANQGLAKGDFRRAFQEGDCALLLDGLDEAPDDQQRQRARGLIETLARAYKDCPLVVTSRPAAYQDKAVLAGFTHTHIEALDAAAIDGFLARWSRALFPESENRAERHRKELAAALGERPEIRRMARNTVMLTALAVVHWNEKRLPEQRAELYESILNWLVKQREQRPGREKSQRCRQLLAELALAMQTDPGGRQVQVTRRWAAERLAPRFGSDAEATTRAEAFLAEEEIDSGIVVRRGHQLRFWHLTFQEYLSAQALAGWEDARRTDLLLDTSDKKTPALYRPEWRETVLLLAGVLCVQGQAKVDGLVAAVLDRLGANPSRAEAARAAGLLGAVVQDLSPFGYRLADPRYAALLAAAMAVFDAKQAAKIPLQDRIAAAGALARAGDPRLGWTRPGRWVPLAGGTFAMGAQAKDPKAPGHDPEASDDEAPVHTVTVDSFQIGRFPVTVAEYAEFVDDEDVADPRWWQAGGGDKGSVPEKWEEQQAHPSRPVVRVTWHQAMAFCAWLTGRLARPHGAKGEVLMPAGCVARLPTEAEWEFAARGTEGRRYPWGNPRPNAGRANFDKTNVGEPSPVGIFPLGTTPDGVVDLAGNVWEWCLDAYDKGFYARCAKQGTARNRVAAGDAAVPRVLRGGSYIIGSWYLRATNRYRYQPEFRIRNNGFRCVLAPPRQAVIS